MYLDTGCWDTAFKVLMECSGLVHSADPKEIDDLEKYLHERLPPVGDGAQSGS